MAEMTAFPFVCDKCSQKYEIKEFVDVALFWGFIFLSHRSRSAIGLTCPSCTFTTLRLFPEQPEDFSIELLESEGSEQVGGFQYQPAFRFYVPFQISF